MISPRASLITLAASLLLLSTAGAETSAYSTVMSARQFAIGGIGVAGVISKEELALRAIQDGPRAEEQLRKLLREGTPAGQMYALFGLRQIDAADYAALAEPYRRNSKSVGRISGCNVYTESMSEVVRWIDQWARKLKTREKKS